MTILRSMTIGKAIQEKAQKYIDLYEAIKAKPDSFITPDMAAYDLTTEIYIAEQALELVKEYMAKDKEVS